MKERKWNARIQRARDLEKTYPFAAEGLRFYARVAQFQRDFYTDLSRDLANSPDLSSDRPLRSRLDLPVLLTKLADFLHLIATIAPVPLAEAAVSARLLADPGLSEEMLRSFWEEEGHGWENMGDMEDLPRAPRAYQHQLAWIFLQPYAEFLADLRQPTAGNGAPLTCPLCGGRPIVGVLRSEGDGAKKSLVCMLCAHEWAFRRVYCVSCGEEREPQMAFYSAPEIPHVRVDVCDTCHAYLKSVDLTKAGLAVPIVDELATIPLDLWAREHGYHKLQTNLLGM